MVLSRPQPVYLYYLEISLSLTKLQIYSFCEYPINSFEMPKNQKATTRKQINKSYKKHHQYIYLVSHWLGKIQSPRPLQPPKLQQICNFSSKNIQSKNKKTESNTSSCYRKNQIFIFQVNSLLTVCSYHAPFAFQREFTFYSSLNVNELLARNDAKSELKVSVVHELSDCGFESSCSHLNSLWFLQIRDYIG